mmetsp:Transcript_24544/g.79250  ORF Transcript_24544/g.79250 Transcript_24544/m.79250 type:complete len:239 (-) Transcript_24544:181-897(-)
MCRSWCRRCRGPHAGREVRPRPTRRSTRVTSERRATGRRVPAGCAPSWHSNVVPSEWGARRWRPGIGAGTTCRRAGRFARDQTLAPPRRRSRPRLRRRASWTHREGQSARLPPSARRCGSSEAAGTRRVADRPTGPAGWGKRRESRAWLTRGSGPSRLTVRRRAPAETHPSHRACPPRASAHLAWPPSPAPLAVWPGAAAKNATGPRQEHAERQEGRTSKCLRAPHGARVPQRPECCA